MAGTLQSTIRRNDFFRYRLTRQRVFFLAALILTFFLINFLLTGLPALQPETARQMEMARIPTGFERQRFKESPDLVGIDPKYYGYYKAASKSGKFKCIASGEVIPWRHVNDDYCDCKDDGSDEPRSTACSFFVVQQFFYCTSKGTSVSPKKIPAAWINDGICDCCAGEDEMTIPCPNVCSSKNTWRLRRS